MVITAASKVVVIQLVGRAIDPAPVSRTIANESPPEEIVGKLKRRQQNPVLVVLTSDAEGFVVRQVERTEHPGSLSLAV